MPSAPERSPAAPPTSSSASSSRRILSKIASPFSTTPRAVAEFSVAVKDEHKQYSPGDAVRGSITIRTNKPTRITHIVVSLHGFVQVYKNPGATNEDYKSGAARNQRSGEAFGNGFASLFEPDEVVLCGDGKLTEGTFRFEFELEFPAHNLPSSIDFERGTVAYMVTATLTRPTTITPVMTSERKIYFVDRIDVSQISGPKPRTITLEAIRKRPKARNHARKIADSSDKLGRASDSQRHGSDPHITSRSPSLPSTHNTETGIPDSPVPSDISFDSAFSNVPASQSESHFAPSVTASESGITINSKLSQPNKIITATVEPDTGGCLRGDTISVKINISHTKHIKSLYGVIVTFYRQARVDMHPTKPLGPTEKGKSSRYEDYYPKSMTGLGGLSLSGAGSIHIFRKDLSQTTMPLLIDPNTLTTEVNAKIRVPENAFPTITNVPGSMINFQYYIEVVLDIQGKLSGLDRGIASMPGAIPDQTTVADTPNTERSAAAPFGPSIIDTFPVRRDKSVVTCTFEIIVGTRDSERRRGKRKAVEPTTAQQPVNGHSQAEPRSPGDDRGHDQDQRQHNGTNGEDYSNQNGYWYYPEQYDPRWYNYGYNGYYGYDYEQYEPSSSQEPRDQQWPRDDPSYDSRYNYPQQPHVPIPQMPDESAMSEKERVRQAEARLLPSQPPPTNGAQASSSSNPADEEATAPYLPDEDSSAPPESAWAAGPSYRPPASSDPVVASSSSTSAFAPQPCSSIPQYEPPLTGSSTQTTIPPPTDDKQELQRRALQDAESAPPDFGLSEEQDADADEGLNGDDGPADSALPLPLPSSQQLSDLPPDEHEASAPTIEEADAVAHDSHADAPGSSGLPRYER